MIARMRGLAGRVPAPGWMMLALAAGFAAGVLLVRQAGIIAAAGFVGGVWLDALRMTIVPLIFALVTTGVATLAAGGGARGEAQRIGRRLPLLFAALLVASAVFTALAVPPLLGLFPVPPEALAALRQAFPAAPAPEMPTTLAAIRALVPVNVVASAAEGAVVPLVMFALVLGLALPRVAGDRAEALLLPLRGLSDAMIVIVGWVLRIAPLGIFALAMVIGATVGTAVVGLLARYILVSVVISLALIVAAYILVRALAGVSPVRFARAVAPAQAVAASTQSSIATLPAMLASARRLGIPDREAAVVLPLAVAVFKITAPANAMIYGLALAWLAGVPVPAATIALAVPLAALSTLAVLGMPGPVSAFAATAPTALALGAPLELFPILLAVDVIPDMFRTAGNVTYDVAVATIVAPPED